MTRIDEDWRCYSKIVKDWQRSSKSDKDWQRSSKMTENDGDQRFIKIHKDGQKWRSTKIVKIDKNRRVVKGWSTSDKSSQVYKTVPDQNCQRPNKNEQLKTENWKSTNFLFYTNCKENVNIWLTRLCAHLFTVLKRKIVSIWTLHYNNHCEILNKQNHD